MPPYQAIREIQNRLNASVYTKSEKWMTPQWVVRQFDKLTEVSSDTPLPNNRNLNWAVIGQAGSSGYGVLDTAGLLSVHPDCGSIDFWLNTPDGILFPSMEDRKGSQAVLLSPEDQVFEWAASIGPVRFTRSIYLANNGKDSEAVYNEIHLQNRSLEPTTFTFYVLVRPMSVFGVEPIERLQYEKTQLAVYSNRKLALVFDEPPTSVVFTSGSDSSLPSKIHSLAGKFDDEYKDPHGLGTAIIRYDVRLGPAGSQRFFFVSPTNNFEHGQRTPEFYMSQELRDESVANWYEFSQMSHQGTFPERRFDSILMQARASLAIMARSFILKERPTTPWFERARLLESLCLSNSVKLAEELAIELTKMIKLDGDEYESSKYSPLLWGILQVYSYSKNISFLRMIRPFINSLVSGIIRQNEHQMASETRPLIEPDTPSDEIVALSSETSLGSEDSPPPLDSSVPDQEIVISEKVWTFDDLHSSLWNLLALMIAMESLEQLGDTDRTSRVEEHLSDYLSIITKQYAQVLGSVEELNVRDILSTEDGLRNLLDLVLLSCDFIKLGHLPNHLKRLISIIHEYNVVDSLLCIPGTPRKCSSHLALRLGRYHSICGNRFEAEQLLLRVLDFVSEFDTLPDWINFSTTGGSDGFGCSIFAASDLLAFLRYSVIYEKDPETVLLRGIPSEWYTSGVPMELINVVSRSGPITIGIGASANQNQIEIQMDELPQEIEVHLPTHIPISMVKVFGGGVAERVKNERGAFIRIVPLSNEIVLTFHK